jgi:hypothetical protein
MAYYNLFCEDKLAVGKGIHPKHSSARITDGQYLIIKREIKKRRKMGDTTHEVYLKNSLLL